MDLTAYKDHRTRLNRSRSSSCCSLFRKRFFYQEVYSLGSNTLVRSYSSDEVWDKEKDRLFQTTQVSSFITSPKRGYVSPEEKTANEPRKLPPGQSMSEADMARKKKKAKEETPEKSGEFTLTLKKTVIFILVTSITAYAVQFYREFRECNKVWDIHKTGAELSEKIFGQQFALSQINSALKDCTHGSDVYVMVFTGSVGVGKTYASTIIRRNFPWRIRKRIPFSERFDRDVHALFSEVAPLTCGCNLIIIDNLTVFAAKVAIDFVKQVNTIRKNNEKFLIILIFKTSNVNQKDDIIRHFKKFNVNFVHASFFPLNETIVRKCYSLEIKRHGIEIPEKELNKMVHYRMNYTSPDKTTSGCKGVAVDVASYLNKTAH